MKLFKPIFKHWSYLADFIVIVAGIIVALSLDNWNSERQKTKLQGQLLVELTDELQSNIDRIVFLDSINVGPMRVVDSLLQMKVSLLDNGIEQDEVADLCKGAPWRYNKFNLTTFVFDQMKESNILNSLDTELKMAIKQYYKLLDVQELYNDNSYHRILKVVDECTHGFMELRSDYYKDSLSYLHKHQWIFNESSKNYIDMKHYLKIVAFNVRESRDRMLTIIAESKKLKMLATKYIN